MVGENYAYVIYCFIKCGNHTFLFIKDIFDYFFVNTQFWNAEFEDVNELIMRKRRKWINPWCHNGTSKKLIEDINNKPTYLKIGVPEWNRLKLRQILL